MYRMRESRDVLKVEMYRKERKGKESRVESLGKIELGITDPSLLL